MWLFAFQIQKEKIHKMSFSDKEIKWASPFRNSEIRLPLGSTQYNSMGARETHDQSHLKCGVDLNCDSGTSVYAVESGNIVSIETFFNNKKRPWISSSKAVLVEGPNGVVCYGNVAVNNNLKIGAQIKQGDAIGTVVSYYKKEQNKGTSRLRIELYRFGTIKRPKWRIGKPPPKNLLNPTSLLMPLIITTIQRRRPFSSKLANKSF